MKSLAELQAIKEKMRDKVVLREGTNATRVVVGMATCAIATKSFRCFATTMRLQSVPIPRKITTRSFRL